MLRVRLYTDIIRMDHYVYKIIEITLTMNLYNIYGLWHSYAFRTLKTFESGWMRFFSPPYKWT